MEQQNNNNHHHPHDSKKEPTQQDRSTQKGATNTRKGATKFTHNAKNFIPATIEKIGKATDNALETTRRDLKDIRNQRTIGEKRRALTGAIKRRIGNSKAMRKLGQRWKQSTFRAILLTGPVKVWLTLIILCLTILLLNIAFVFIGIGQSFGPTQHYYCDADAPPEVKASAWYRLYCSGGGGDNSTIAAAAVELATTDRTLGGMPIRSTSASSGMNDLMPYRNTHGYKVESFIDYVPQIIAAADSYPKKDTNGWHANFYASCDLSVALAVWWAGADPNYPAILGGWQEFSSGKLGTSQAGYLVNRKPKDWIEVKRGDRVQPGDVALGNYHGSDGAWHTWMYIATWENGKYIENEAAQKKFPGSKATLYEGSHHGDSAAGGFYACLGVDSNPWESAERIFRYVGEIDENSPIKKIGGGGK